MTAERAIEAELALIGSMLVDRAGFEGGKQSVSESDFGLEANRIMFRAICACADQGVVGDITCVMSKLRETSHLESVGGGPSLARYYDAVVCSDNVGHYAKIVLAASIERQIDAHAVTLQKDRSGENFAKYRDLQAKLDAIYQPSVFNFRDGLEGAVNKILGARPTIIRTNFPSLDYQLGGSEPGDLITVGARTGGGKTAIMVKMLINMAERGIHCLYLTTEMTSEQIVSRVLPAATGVHAWKFREKKFSEHDRGMIRGASTGGLKSLQIHLYDKARIGISDIRAVAKEVKPRVIFLDYLQRCVLPEGSSRAYQIQEFMTELKTFAMETGTVVFVGCQLARGLDKAGAGKPTNSDLKDSGAIEAESDQIILLWKKDAEEVAKMPIQPPANHASISAMVSKNRHGQAGEVVDLLLNGPFVDMIDSREPTNIQEEVSF